MIIGAAGSGGVERQASRVLTRVCCGCRRVAQADGSWVVDPAPARTPAAPVSHGLCDPCLDRLYGPLLAR